MNLLEALPVVFRLLMLLVIGAGLGAAANLAVYQLGYFRRRPISPWGPLAREAGPRYWYHRVPIAGWWLVRRDAGLHGPGFWIRPMMVEVAAAAGLVWFYHWHAAGGLVGFDPWVDQTGEAQRLGWLLLHTALAWLLLVASLIDLDEQTIPDAVTIPGTLLALAVLAVWPELRLPDWEPRLAVPFAAVVPLTFTAPDPMVEWHRGTGGLALALGVLALWCWALLPKRLTWRYGVGRGLRLIYLSVRRPARQTTGRLPIARPRRMGTLTRVLLLIAVAGALGIVAGWLVGGAHWDSLFGSILGLAFGGGMVWAVRIVASWALGQEAMGFGDVVLMAMIGAMLGWQASLLVFALAPFAALVVALGQLIVTRVAHIAFGPYLSLAAIVLLLWWPTVWNQWARTGPFALGGWLLLILVAALAMMPPLLMAMRLLRGSESRRDSA